MKDGFQIVKRPAGELRRAGNVDAPGSLCLPTHVEVSMSKAILALSAALFVCASAPIALADEGGAMTGAVGGAAVGAAVGGPVGAVIGGVGGAAVGNSMSNHRYYYPRHYVYHPYHHRHYYYYER
jgi:hypothetical protein